MSATTRLRKNHDPELSRLYPSCYPCFKAAVRCSSTDNQGTRPCDRCVENSLPEEECIPHQHDARWVAGKSGATNKRGVGNGSRDSANYGSVRGPTSIIEALRRSSRSTRSTVNYADAETGEEDQASASEQGTAVDTAEEVADNEEGTPAQQAAAGEIETSTTASTSVNRAHRVNKNARQPDQDDY